MTNVATLSLVHVADRTSSAIRLGGRAFSRVATAAGEYLGLAQGIIIGAGPLASSAAKHEERGRVLNV